VRGRGTGLLIKEAGRTEYASMRHFDFGQIKPILILAWHLHSQVIDRHWFITIIMTAAACIPGFQWYFATYTIQCLPMIQLIDIGPGTWEIKIISTSCITGIIL
jgi:hypothetical protein